MATETNENVVDEALAAADQELGDNFDGDFEESPEPAAAAPVEDDPLDREVPEDKLSGYWKNKKKQSGQPVRFRNLIEGSEEAEEKIRQQGEAANTAREEARVLRATLQATQEMLREMRNPAQPPKVAGYEDVGIHDATQTLLNEPDRFGNATADLGARRAAEQINPRIQNVEQQLESLRQQAELNLVRSAADSARAELGIEPERWKSLGGFMWAAAANDPRTPKNPEAWKDAYKGMEAAFPQAAPRTTTPQEGIVRGNPGGSSRPVPVQSAAPKQRVRGLVNTVTDDAVRLGYLPKELADEVKSRTEEKLRQKESR